LKEEWKNAYVEALQELVRAHGPNRSERFIPFLLVLSKKMSDPRYETSLVIARYFVENALLSTEEDEIFWKCLRSELPEDVPRWYPPPRVPLPLQDYLKVIYDLRQTFPRSTEEKPEPRA
jgi:hypothetical protein